MQSTLRNVWVIARHEYAINVVRPGFIFFTLLVPALGLITLIVAVFYSGQALSALESTFQPRLLPIGVVDESGLVTPIPAAYADQFELFADGEAARQAMIAERVSGFVVISSDYLTSGKITGYTPAGFSGIVNLDSEALRAMLVHTLVADKVDATTLARVVDPVELDLVTVDRSGQPTTEGPLTIIAGFVLPYIFSVLLVVSIFVSSSYLLRSVSEEKETRVIEVVLSSVTAAELLAGKVIGLGALGLTQIGVWIGSSVLLSGGAGALVAGAVMLLRPEMLVLGAVYFLLGYIIYGTLMAAAGSLGTNMRESQQLAGIFSITAAIPWMINGFLFGNPNALVARVLSFFPLTAPTMMMLRLPLGQVPAVDIAGSIIVLLLSIPAAIWASGKVFRVGLLMYGKRPTLREIAYILRRA